MYQENDQHDLALTHFERALRMDRDDDKTLYRPGQTLLDLDRNEEAVEMLSRSIRSEPERGGAHVKLAQALRQLDREQEAIAVLERPRGLVPDDDPYYPVILKALGESKP